MVQRCSVCLQVGVLIIGAGERAPDVHLLQHLLLKYNDGMEVLRWLDTCNMRQHLCPCVGPTGLGAATRLHQHGLKDWLLVDKVTTLPSLPG